MKKTTSLGRLLATLNPERRSGIFIVTSLPRSEEISFPIEALIRETEGTTVVVSEKVAEANKLQSWLRAAWITLSVTSELTAVGLTAAVSEALAASDIPCNVLAGARHDHILVPEDLADQAMSSLKRLQAEAERRT